jgi:hypothetical protein
MELAAARVSIARRPRCPIDWPRLGLVAEIRDPFGAAGLVAELAVELAGLDLDPAHPDDSEFDLDQAENQAAGQLDQAELLADWPTPISTRWVERTAKRHSCDRCHGDIEPAEPARVDTIKNDRGRIASVYICGECEHPSRGGTTNADRNGCKLWEESGSGRGESWERGYFGSSH